MDTKLHNDDDEDAISRSYDPYLLMFAHAGNGQHGLLDVLYYCSGFGLDWIGCWNLDTLKEHATEDQFSLCIVYRVSCIV
jgi:hypothetical protein